MSLFRHCQSVVALGQKQAGMEAGSLFLLQYNKSCTPTVLPVQWEASCSDKGSNA